MPGVAYVFTYDLSRQPSSKKVRFVYLLKGRRGELGMVKKLKGRFLAPGCFIIPEKSLEEIEQIFKLWNIKHKKIKVMLIH